MAYKMLVDDFKLIRVKIAQAMLDSIQGCVSLEKQFTVERGFFMSKFR